jgi:hypothetical protein
MRRLNESGAVNWAAATCVAVLVVAAILLFGWTNELNIGGK